MFKKIRTSKVTKFIVYYLSIMMFLEITQPMAIYALTEGPSQPEFNSFTPIGTSDMVDLASGDLNYNIPIMDVGGYPLNLAYNSGVSMDQEASWVGLGWDMNVGQISRQMRGLPDDFDGDPMVYENNMKDNITVGGGAGVFVSGLGIAEAGEKGPISINAGIGMKYNNYDGFGFSVNGGISAQVGEHLGVGMQMESSASEGVSASPSISYSSKKDKNVVKDNSLSGSLGLNYNSRKGIENFTFSASRTKKDTKERKVLGENKMKTGYASAGIGGSISFIDGSFTPSKRVAMVSSNYMFNLNIEGEIWGIEPGLKFSGYYAKQGMDPSEKYKVEKGYGYENSQKASGNDVLDFNREKERTVNKNTTTLPVTNYTYDIYNIQGQGVSGMFRPYRSQVGYLFDKTVEDNSNGGSLGLEFGAGGGVHWGFDGTVTHAFSRTGLWSSGNDALSRFGDSNSGNKKDYEKVYFKNIGGTHVDKDGALFADLNTYNPIKISIKGSKFNRELEKGYDFAPEKTNILKRTNRVNRNQAIQKLTKKEAKKYGYKTQFSNYAKPHHTAEIRVIKEGGQRYVYGRALYNHKKREVTFDATFNGYNNLTGLVDYSGKDNSPNNDRKGDRYFNSVETPDYAHSYLLTSVLSSDYQDLTGNGPTDDDLGTYTTFKYKEVPGLYKWRVPFKENKANFDEGLKSLEKDNKGNYQYGEKELTYIDKIETKTHIAVFETSARKDSYGVKGENGGLGADSKMYKLNTIKLYSKPEYKENGLNAIPIKTAHFIYNYDLCPGIDNNKTTEPLDLEHETSNNGGKLTLQKVYFTYKDSKMGAHTPYTFDYINNKPYDMKGYDVWGNYKPTPTGVSVLNDPHSAEMSNAEYPFVDQSDKSKADEYASSWHLGTINLPSGGRMTLEYESDDYKFVQDKQVMQMFKVVGSGIDAQGNGFGAALTPSSTFLYFEIPSAINNAILKEKYISDIQNHEMYFRFLLNMNDPSSILATSTSFDYVSGYLKLGTDHNTFTKNGKNYAAIEIETTILGDGFNNNQTVNPISKAGWIFARQNLSKIAYGLGGNEDNKSVKAIVLEIVGAFSGIMDMFKSPNGQLRDRFIASTFIPGKSWIRLMQPEGNKFGGGSRVKEVRLHDDWKLMSNHTTDENYNQSYGQQYTYKEENGATSGVATYEPLGCKENPLVRPLYDEHNGSGLLLGGESQNYTEYPLGESFFPAPKITYRRVEVKNLPRQEISGTTIIKEVKKHATGKVATEFFTSKDYPTIANMTPIYTKFDKTPILFNLLKLTSKQHLTMTQGFSVHTNDMDGKMRSQRVYGEGQTDAISGVNYKYENQTNSNGSGLLNNNITTIDSQGKVADKIVGVDYDVINDFKFNESFSETSGIKFNTAGLPIFLIFLILPVPLPSNMKNQDYLKTAVTTKVIHTSGILRETVAYDAGAEVSTKNLAWDAETGNVLLTQTVNEFDDNYYSFNYPAYWNQDYKGMGQAAKNLDLISDIKDIVPNGSSAGNFTMVGTSSTIGNRNSDYLMDGDEVWVNPTKGKPLNDPDKVATPFKGWIVNLDKIPNTFNIIDKDGVKVNHNMLIDGSFRVIRSGYRNNQMDNMAAITSMTNPLSILLPIYNPLTMSNDNFLPNNLFDSAIPNTYKIVNASAIEYGNEWPGQCECSLPKMRYDESTPKKLVQQYNANNTNLDEDEILAKSYNPYLFNVLGNWRAKKSYAYLTGRTSGLSATTSSNPGPRNKGFFNDFHPFYVLDNTTHKWSITGTPNYEKWTYASEVAKYNPYGQEVENKDALDRYSSALYGYNYRFPLAVASNSMYKEMGYDGFEDYVFSSCASAAHFNFKEVLDEYNVTISSTQAHSGRKSIRVAPATDAANPRKAILVKKLVDCFGTATATTGGKPASNKPQKNNTK